MNETIEQAIKDVKYVMTLTADQEKYIKIVLEEVFMYGERAEMIRALEALKHESMTEEQLIEKAKVSKDDVTNSSEIL